MLVKISQEVLRTSLKKELEILKRKNSKQRIIPIQADRIILSVLNILYEYISYYNNQRPHQSLEQTSPKSYISHSHGKIESKPILSGLWNDYY